MQKDPHPGKLSLPISVVNRYAYAGNNPLNFADPSGLSFWTDIRDWVIDGLVAIAAFGAIVLSGGTALGALAAIGATAAGALAITGIQTLISGGNFWDNFHHNFRISGLFLAGGAAAAGIWGEGIKSVGANSILQGYVESNAPIFGQAGGLTWGSTAVFSGDSFAQLATHEFGHTLQYIALSGLGRVAGPAVYGGLGLWGLASQWGASGPFGAVGAWWEGAATTAGGWL